MNHYIAFETCFVLAALWTLYHYGYRGVALDSYRQNVFAIRDELFEVAASGTNGFGFSHPTYGRFRTSLNSAIRFAHHVSPLQVLAIMVAVKWKIGILARFGSKPSSVDDLFGASDLHPETKKQLESLHLKAAVALVKYMLISSPGSFFLMLGFLKAFSPQIGPVAAKADELTISKVVEEQAEIELSADGELALAV